MVPGLGSPDWALSVRIFLALVRCARCGYPNGKRQRSMTAYTHESGWVIYCDDCYEEYTYYWSGQWDEYNRSRG